MKYLKILFLFLFLISLANPSIATVDSSNSYLLGIKEFREGNIEKSIKLLEQAIQNNPDSEILKDSYTQLYYNFYLLKKKDKASFYLDKCKKINAKFKSLNDEDFDIEIRITEHIPPSLKKLPKGYSLAYARRETPREISEVAVLLTPIKFSFGEFISDVSMYLNHSFNEYRIKINLNNDGRKKLEEFTNENINRKSNILVNGRPMYQGTITISDPIKDGKLFISGGRYFQPSELDRLYVLLMANKNN